MKQLLIRLARAIIRAYEMPVLQKSDGMAVDGHQVSPLYEGTEYEGTEYKEDYEFYRKRQMREIPTKTGTRGIPTEKAD